MGNRNMRRSVNNFGILQEKNRPILLIFDNKRYKSRRNERWSKMARRINDP
ncbi:MAG: hypothetical protein WAJ93_11915 [Candidatus Nitrosopolaris sp.]